MNIRGLQGQGRDPVVIDGATQEQTVYRGYNGARSGSHVDPDFIGEVSVEKARVPPQTVPVRLVVLYVCVL